MIETMNRELPKVNWIEKLFDWLYIRYIKWFIKQHKQTRIKLSTELFEAYKYYYWKTSLICQKGSQHVGVIVEIEIN